MPIRKTLAPVEFAVDLKEQLEKIEPVRILKRSESPRTGRLVTEHFTLISTSPCSARPNHRCRGVVIYEFEMDGAAASKADTERPVRVALAWATHFDMVNAAERIYITLSVNPYRYGESGNISLPE